MASGSNGNKKYTLESAILSSMFGPGADLALGFGFNSSRFFNRPVSHLIIIVIVVSTVLKIITG